MQKFLTKYWQTESNNTLKKKSYTTTKLDSSQGWFNIHKSINVIYHKKRKDKNHMNISIDAEKAFLNFFFFFLGPHPWHMEVLRLGLNGNYSCWPMPRPQQCQIQAASATYITAHSNARSLTHRVRPGMECTSSWIIVRFVTHWATRGTPIS